MKQGIPNNFIVAVLTVALLTACGQSDQDELQQGEDHKVQQEAMMLMDMAALTMNDVSLGLLSDCPEHPVNDMTDADVLLHIQLRLKRALLRLEAMDTSGWTDERKRQLTEVIEHLTDLIEQLGNDAAFAAEVVAKVRAKLLEMCPVQRDPSTTPRDPGTIDRAKMCQQLELMKGCGCLSGERLRLVEQMHQEYCR